MSNWTRSTAGGLPSAGSRSGMSPLITANCAAILSEIVTLSLVLESVVTSSCSTRVLRVPAMLWPVRQQRKWHPGSAILLNFPHCSTTPTSAWLICCAGSGGWSAKGSRAEGPEPEPERQSDEQLDANGSCVRSVRN